MGTAECDTERSPDMQGCIETDQKDREPYPSYDQRYRRHLFGETGSAECRDRKS